MKKRTLIAGIFGLIATATLVVTLSSFEIKEEAKLNKNINANILKRTGSYDVSVTNGMLNFASSSVYESIFSTDQYVNDDFKAYVTNLTGFTPLINGSTSELKTELGDDYISYILNSNGCVRIGSNIYKVSNDRNSVLVLKSSDINADNLADLYSETSNANIVVYSTVDDVIDLVESNTPPSGAAARCSESGAGERWLSGHSDFEDPNSDGAHGYFDARIFYRRLGIYFALRAQVSAVTFGNCQRRIEMHRDPVHYKVRCGSWFGPLSVWNTTLISSVSNAGSNGSYYGYQGMTPLNAYKFRIVFMAKYIPNPTGVPDPSNDLIIRVNL